MVDEAGPDESVWQLNEGLSYHERKQFHGAGDAIPNAYWYGVPPYNPSQGFGNKGTHVTTATWDVGGEFVLRFARAIDGFPGSGGGLELFFPNGPGGHVIPIGPPRRADPPISIRGGARSVGSG